MQEHQICNHFDESGTITTKVGLCRNLKNLIWFRNVDIDTFYPRCVEVSEPAEKEDFISEFKATKAECILKQAVIDRKANLKALQIAFNVCERRLRDLDELIDDENIDDWELVKEKEWKVISKDVRGPDKLQQLSEAEISRAISVLKKLKEKYPQFEINGMSNIWIVKPGGLSRGRGISCYNTLPEILEHVQKEGTWVVQKYIENPMLVLRKKFDIRQWVLLTSWNPVTAWFYERCYLRFGVEDYSIQDLKNKFIHLTNNSIQKNSELFENSEIEGSMWYSEELAEYIKKNTGSDLWELKIKPKVKEIVMYSLECVQEIVDNRKNSVELYGFDIMIDEEYNPWLIEINASPAMDYSTTVTECLVKEVMEDVIKVIVDYNFASKKKKHSVDTGNFTMLCKSKNAVERPIQSFGINLVCEGKAIKTL
jgi:tubulin monoglycylase TTLL3/8